jgi:hypothetical protein
MISMSILLLVTMRGVSMPILVLPMADAESCRIEKAVLEQYLHRNKDAQARCYDITTQQRAD